jgi:hypothetical protein
MSARSAAYQFGSGFGRVVALVEQQDFGEIVA